MFREDGHPDVPLSDWETFRREVSPYQIDEVLDRSQTKLPDRIVPLARGIAIASRHLLSRAGYRPGSRRPRGWYKCHDGAYRKDDLTVRGYNESSLWHIERNGSLSRPHGYSNMALVHQFGSTPILARTCQAAMHLAEFCSQKAPPVGLRWINQCPDDLFGAIGFAQNRRMNEALRSVRARPRGVGSSFAAEATPLAREKGKTCPPFKHPTLVAPHVSR